MIPIIVIVIASLLVGVVAGLWIKPTRQFCPSCGTSFGCLACQEVNSGAPRSRRTA